MVHCTDVYISPPALRSAEMPLLNLDPNYTSVLSHACIPFPAQLHEPKPLQNLVSQPLLTSLRHTTSRNGLAYRPHSKHVS